MENPNQLAHDLPKWKWIWATNKRDLIGTSAFISLFIIVPLIQSAPGWYIYVPVAIAFWFIAVYLRLTLLYKKNVKYYWNWEETYGDLKS